MLATEVRLSTTISCSDDVTSLYSFELSARVDVRSSQEEKIVR